MGLVKLIRLLFVDPSPPAPSTDGMTDRLDAAVEATNVASAKMAIATDEFRERVRAIRLRLNQGVQ